MKLGTTILLERPYLEGQIYAMREGVLKDKIRILARNSMPELECTNCDAEATDICVECWGVVL